MMKLSTTLLLAAALAACGPTPAPTPDASNDVIVNDVATPTDAPAPDATETDVAAPTDVIAPTDVTTPTDAPAPTDVAAPTDATSEACAPRTPVPPDLMGPGACNTLEFGAPEVMGRMISSPMTFTGGAVPPGIYDAIAYLRTTTSTLMSSFRATLVVGADLRYTEIRQLTAGSTPGPVTRKSGTLMPTGTSFARTVTCGTSDGGDETMSAPYSIADNCGVTLLYFGTSNLYFVYRRRPVP